MDRHINLYEAKKRLSALVDQAALGEEVVISKNGVPCATLALIAGGVVTRSPANAMKISFIVEDSDDADAEMAALFDGSA
jgi:antitoxin (DNA-binding transcriptional repressor) of toxin-antitoxin stability system